MDGLYFPFQGLGEYVVFEVLPEDGDTDVPAVFTIQGRTRPWRSQNSATSVSDLAFGELGLTFHVSSIIMMLMTSQTFVTYRFK